MTFGGFIYNLIELKVYDTLGIIEKHSGVCIKLSSCYVKYHTVQITLIRKNITNCTYNSLVLQISDN